MIAIKGAGGGRVLVVTTSVTLGVDPVEVWPLLTNSRMDRAPRCPVFAVGTPRPVACALPDGVGGVGAQRECRATQGVVRQRITRWEPAEVLEFRMEQTDLAFARWVAGIDERFQLAPADGRTRLTRTTTVAMQGAFPALTAVAMSVGLKAVHRHVFGSWRRQCQNLSPMAGQPGSLANFRTA
ncbi:hypothetical protein GCM10009679_56050 [Saccharothrix algeriensis]|uniref:Uncharacterized protein n=2 Tax=Catellatospora bangladeshensis TaxID=310355 RepID=A0A8J3JDZ3_9ACTN|nr:hypothetical protein Cba03nite_40050 [Catellatospora bangladeshensis]